MAGEERLFTAESVTEGHPDKMCDQLVDAVLDAVLHQDKYARVSCDAMVTTGLVLLAGEISTKSYVDLAGLVRKTIEEIGYTDPALSFDYQSCAVLATIEEQSPEIGLAVDKRGAGDLGVVVGYATDEGNALSASTDFMPVPIALAHRLAATLARVRRGKRVPYLYPDGKSQVTVRYEDGVPRQVTSVVVCAQHRPETEFESLQEDLRREVLLPVLRESGLEIPPDDQLLVNPGGPFTRGGPQVDVGLSGRKCVVDTYGSACRHGGSSLSGKDPTKIERSAAYGARYLAKNLVASGVAHRCEVQLGYVIGVPEPVSVLCETFGTSEIADARLARLLSEVMDLTPAGIIERLDLRRPLYRPTATYGHFGRPELGLPWETTDLAAEMRERLGREGS